MYTGELALAAFALTAVGWLSREIWRWRKTKKLAMQDATRILNEKKKLLQGMLSKEDDYSSRQTLTARVDEVNTALLALYSERLRRTLKDAGLPTEEMLVADGHGHLPQREAKRLEASIEELRSLPPLLSTRDLLVLGNAYYYIERYDDAKRVFDTILNLHPNDPHALNSRGIIHSKLGRHEEALGDYDRALELMPNNATILMNRGVAYYDLKRDEEALDNYNRSLQIRPDDPMTLNNRGATYARLGNTEDAIDDLNRALEIKEHPYVRFNRGWTYKCLRRYEDALNDFNRALDVNPTDSDTLYELGRLFALWGKTDDALTYLKRAIRLDKKYREKAKTDGEFANIRDDPRFKDMMERD
jgi:tetratricopeptide (TPR) repeat protein